MLRSLTRGLTRSFCANKNIQQTGSSAVMEPIKSNEVPVHLRPYDRKKYEVPMEKIKLNSGTVLLKQDTHSWKSNLSLVQKS